MDSTQVMLVQLKQFVRSSDSALSAKTTSNDRVNQPPRPAFVSGSQVRDFYETTVGKKAFEKSETEHQRDAQAKPLTKRRKSSRLNKSALNVNHFMRAVESGDPKEVGRILEESGDAVNCRDQFGWTPLMCACRAGHLETVRLLLQKGADVTARDRRGNTCGRLAQTAGHAAVVRLLEGFQPDQERGSEPESMHSPFFCDVCKQQVEGSSLKKHLASTVHNFHASSKRRTPTVYGIPENNRGFQILVRSGWDKETGLGPSGEGHKFPPKTVLKQDRSGLGAKRYKPRVTHSLESVNEERKQKWLTKTNVRSAKQEEQRLERSLRIMLT